MQVLTLMLTLMNSRVNVNMEVKVMEEVMEEVWIDWNSDRKRRYIERMKQKGLSWREMAKQLGLSETTVYMWAKRNCPNLVGDHKIPRHDDTAIKFLKIFYALFSELRSFISEHQYERVLARFIELTEQENLDFTKLEEVIH